MVEREASAFVCIASGRPFGAVSRCRFVEEIFNEELRVNLSQECVVWWSDLQTCHKCGSTCDTILSKTTGPLGSVSLVLR